MSIDGAREADVSFFDIHHQRKVYAKRHFVGCNIDSFK